MKSRESLHQDITFFLWIICISLFIVAFKNIVLYCIFSTALFAIIYYRAKYSFFTALSFILVFSLYQTMIQYLTGKARGMIENAVARTPLYENEHGLCTLSFLLTLIFFIFFTDLIKNELKIYQINIALTNVTTFLLIIAAIVLVLLMFPSIPDFKLHFDIRRSQGMMVNYGWVLTALVLAALTIDMAYKLKWLWICYIFIVFWVLGHAERVECLGFIIYIVLKVINKRTVNVDKNVGDGYFNKQKKPSLMKKISIFAALLVVFLLLIVLGVYRESDNVGRNEYSLLNIMNKLIVQATAGDVIYVFDCAVDMWKKGHLVYGVTYLDWILNMIPGASPQYQVAHYIKKWYFTMGGALFFTEPMMNFGMIGVLVTNIIFCCFYSFILKKQTVLRAMIFLPMVIEIFRTAWYGRNGWQLASFVEIPLLYFGIKVVTNRFKLTI